MLGRNEVMMARTIWTGYLSFGLVNVAVGLYPATKDHTIHFTQLHKGTSNRVRYKKVDEITGEELDISDIVNGYAVGEGEYVVLTRNEMKAAAPGKSDLIEISDFVALEEIDPIYFRQTYYLGPRGRASDRAYSLLRQAMHETDRVGIATLVLHEKEHLVAVRPAKGVLALETMFFDDEILDPKAQLGSMPTDLDPKARELTIAKQLIESMVAQWSPQSYHDTYRERVEQLVESRRAGRPMVPRSSQPKSNVVDLMAALEESVARSNRARKRQRP